MTRSSATRGAGGEKPRHSQDKFIRTLGKVLAARRLEIGLTQPEVAGLVGGYRVLISDYENGKHNPSVINFFYLTQALNINMSEVMRRVERALVSKAAMKKLEESATKKIARNKATAKVQTASGRTKAQKVRDVAKAKKASHENRHSDSKVAGREDRAIARNGKSPEMHCV